MATKVVAAAFSAGMLFLWAQSTQPPAPRRKGPRPESSPIYNREIITDASGNVISDTAGPPKEPARAEPREAGEDAPAPSPTEAGAAAPRERPADQPVDFIDEVRERTFEFSETLPNFLVEQFTWRFTSETKPVSWTARDRISAEVVSENGKEDYRNIKLNGKPLKKGSPEDSGSWSTGEFSSIALSLMAPGTQARFLPKGSSRLGTLSSKLYDYTVEQPNSRWRVTFEGQSIYPAYKGSVWFDPQRKRVLRIEMQARQIPAEFPGDAVEMVVDYGFVRIGGQEYLLPVKAESLFCKRGTMLCSRNETEFRNYRKFSAESTISTTDSTVSFDGEEKAEPQKSEPKSKSKKK